MQPVGWSAAPRHVLIGLVLLTLPIAARAQGLGALESRRIGSVRFDPDEWQHDAASDSGLHLGTPLTSAGVREALQTLWRLRRYSDVRVLVDVLASGDLAVTFRTLPILRVGEIRVRGNRGLSREEVVRALGYAPDREVTPEDLPNIEAAAERGYSEHGYGAARATVSITRSNEPGRVRLDVVIEEGPPVRVAQVRYIGHLALDRQLVTSTVDLGAGSIFDQVKLRQGLTRLRELYRASGYYSAEIRDPQLVELEDGRIGLEIPVEAGNRFVIRFEGDLRARRGDLMAALELENERELSEGVLATLAQRIEDFYRVRGHRKAVVHPRVEPDPRRHVTTVTFRILEGPQVRVKQVWFGGNEHFDDAFLREQVYSFLEEEVPTRFFFQPVDTDALDDLGISGRPGARVGYDRPPPIRVAAREVFDEEIYQHALDHLIELYKAEGYLAVVIDAPVLVENRLDVAVRIRIHEGPRTLISQVRYLGNRALTSAQLAMATGLRAGEPLAFLTSEEALAKLKEEYANSGFLFVRIEQQVETSEDGRRARITFTIEERARVRVTGIVIRGNELSSAGLIRDRMTIEPGDYFTPREAGRSRERLTALGVFSSVSVETLDPTVEEADKAVVVTVTERKTQYIDGRLGGSTGDGLRAGLEYGFRNLFGYAMTLSLRIELSYQVFFYDSTFEGFFQDLSLGDQLERRVVLALTLPATPRLSFLTTSLQLSHQRQNELTFGYTTNGVLLSFTTAALRPFAPRLDLGIESADQDIFNQDALDDYLATHDDLRLRRLLRVPKGQSAFETVGGSLALDLRDNPFSPTRGLFASITAEYVQSLLEQTYPSQFIKTSALVSGYIPIGKGGVVLALSGRVGRIYHLATGSEAYQNRRFFLGGVDTVRGFPDESMYSQNVADAVKQQLEETPNASPPPIFPGGEAFITMRSELRFPIFGGLAGGLFLDTGNLWSRVDQVSDATFSPFTLRYAVGAGIRYATPVGALALDYGLNLQPRRYGEALDEPTGALHFSIGLF